MGRTLSHPLVVRASLASLWIESNMAESSGVARMLLTKSRMSAFFSESPMFRRATRALRADRFSSSFFSYSCLTALLLTFCRHVILRGSIRLSRPRKSRINKGRNINWEVDINPVFQFKCWYLPETLILQYQIQIKYKYSQ